MKSQIKTRIAKGGEDIAANFLLKQGYRIMERNWRSGRFGEIDIIAKDKDGLIIFIEVKTIRQKEDSFGIPEAGFAVIDWRKRRKIVVTAASYLSQKRIVDQAARLDTIRILFSDFNESEGEPLINNPQITHVTEAFYV